VNRRSRRQLLGGGLAVAGIGLLAGCGFPFGSAAQPARLRRIGLLATGTATSQVPNVEAFRQGLRELGYVEGRNVTLEQRNADGWEDRLPELAAELIRLEVDLIVTGGAIAIHATGQATTSIPIVFAATADPVADGLVASLAKPGGNITGLTSYAGEEHAKGLELLNEVVPGLSRVGVLWDRSGLRAFGATQAAARRLGVQVIPQSYRRAATYVAKILEGARPADRPVQLPTTFDFVVNLKTAQALGLTIPPGVLAQATQIIE
jgi:ABC-type uncharacterized transport system substrate-binding protein